MPAWICGVDGWDALTWGAVLIAFGALAGWCARGQV